MNIKKILVILVLIILAGAAIFFTSGSKKDFSPVATTTPAVENDNLPNNSGNSSIDLQIPEQTLPLSNNPKDEAWTVFQKYLAYNKDFNLEGVKKTVYKVNPVCATAVASDECRGRMEMAYSYGSALKKEDFVNVWSDKKQIILATDFKIEEDDSIIARNRSIIFFVRDENQNLKMLSFSPFKGATVSKGTASLQELNDRLVTYTEDKDQDGLADYMEECIPAEVKDTCKPTNSKIRDTDGDGWWDGIEPLF